MQEVLDNLPLPFVKFGAEGNVQYSNPLAKALSPALAKTRLGDWLPEGQWESLKDDLLAPAPFSLTIDGIAYQALLSKVTSATDVYYLMTLTNLEKENVSVKSSR